MTEHDIEQTINECLMSIASRIDTSIDSLDQGDVETALTILRRLRAIMPKPEQRHVASAVAEVQK